MNSKKVQVQVVGFQVSNTSRVIIPGMGIPAYPVRYYDSKGVLAAINLPVCSVYDCTLVFEDEKLVIGTFEIVCQINSTGRQTLFEKFINICLIRSLFNKFGMRVLQKIDTKNQSNEIYKLEFRIPMTTKTFESIK